MTDYFEDVDQMKTKIREKYPYGLEEIWEQNGPKDPKDLKAVTGNEIHVISTAVHGREIEKSTEEFAQRLYNRVRKERKQSMVYKLISNITTDDSKKLVPTTGCGTKEKPCYRNAGHITSARFWTDDFQKLLPSRYPCSFHGFSEKEVEIKKGEGKEPVAIILGGLSGQKYAVAEKFYNDKRKKQNYNIAVCKKYNDCRIYDPSKSADKFEEWPVKFDASSLAGTHKDNFVNRGINGCGIQIEMSYAFRTLDSKYKSDWDLLIDSIVSTLPNDKNEICQ